jgi:hypothetical protein
MATSKRKSRRQRREQPCRSARLGALLLKLHHGLRKVELCRRELKELGFSDRRWQEIVNDVNPDMRFAVRPRLLDAILDFLESAAEPVPREVLARELTAQGAGLLLRVRHSIAANLRNKSLASFPGDKIGLPEWKKDARGSR